jgi:hypothetical protein
MDAGKTNRSTVPWLTMVAAAAIGFLVARAVAGSGFVREAATTASASREPAELTRPPSGTAALDAALPPVPREDLPIADAFDALAVRARHGDFAANERLLRGLVHCRTYGEAGYQPSHTQPNPEHSEAELRELHAWFESGQAFCEHLSQPERASEAEWLERAADAGDPEAMFCFAVEAPQSHMEPMSTEWLDLRRRYIAHSRDYAERAFAEGYLAAAGALYASYADARPWSLALQFTVPAGARDLERAYGFARVQADRMRDIPEVRREIAAEWSDRADLLAAQLSDEQRARGDAFALAHEARAIPAARGLCANVAVLP